MSERVRLYDSNVYLGAGAYGHAQVWSVDGTVVRFWYDCDQRGGRLNAVNGHLSIFDGLGWRDFETMRSEARVTDNTCQIVADLEDRLLTAYEAVREVIAL